MRRANRLRKSQRRRQNEKLRRQQIEFWQKTVGPLPGHLVQWFESIEPNIFDCARESWERAPMHMIDVDAYCIDAERQSAMSQRASHIRTQERDRRIGEMRALCRDIWGVWGKARIVQHRWLKHEKELVPLRTIQHYFRMTRT